MEKKADKCSASLYFHLVCSCPVGHSKLCVPESEWVETAQLHSKGHRYRELTHGG